MVRNVPRQVRLCQGHEKRKNPFTSLDANGRTHLHVHGIPHVIRRYPAFSPAHGTGKML